MRDNLARGPEASFIFYQPQTERKREKKQEQKQGSCAESHARYSYANSSCRTSPCAEEDSQAEIEGV